MCNNCATMEAQSREDERIHFPCVRRQPRLLETEHSCATKNHLTTSNIERVCVCWCTWACVCVCVCVFVYVCVCVGVRGLVYVCNLDC